MKCIYCEKEHRSKGSLAQHLRFCKANPKWDESAWQRTLAAKKARGRLSFYDDPTYKEKQRAKALGRKCTPETRALLSAKSKEYFNITEHREKHSVLMREAVLRSPESYSTKNVVGRVRNIAYRDGIVLKGSWELAVAKALDEMGICWEQPSNGIPYLWNYKEHFYFPDFYLPDRDLYIEVKGYERERDRAKWSAISNLLVLKESAIKKIANGDRNFL